MQKPNESSSNAGKNSDEQKTTASAGTDTKKTAADDKNKTTAEKSSEEKDTSKATGKDSGSEQFDTKSTVPEMHKGSESSDSGGQSSNEGDEGEEKPLKKFFVDALKDIYYAEHAMLEALPKMQKAATTEELQDAFEDHELMTRKQVSRLEKVFRHIDEKAEKKKCEAIEGLIKEAENIIQSTPEGSMTRDAALIIAAQKIEHYEIASYGGLVQLAITLGYDKAVDLLETTLEEEEDTDYDLTDIAESFINFGAKDEEADDDFDEYDDEEYDEEYDEYDDEE